MDAQSQDIIEEVVARLSRIQPASGIAPPDGRPSESSDAMHNDNAEHRSEAPTAEIVQIVEPRMRNALFVNG